MKNKKTNSYIRFIVIILISGFIGGIIGGVLGTVHSMAGGSIQSAMEHFMSQMQSMMLPLLIIITILSIIIGELNLHKLKTVGDHVLESEDEACDEWEYEEEKVSAFTTNINTLSQVICVVVLSFGYSFRYIDNSHSNQFTLACLVFVGCFVYDGILSVRMIKRIQKTHPEKAGDPSSRKFQQQWIESCDEAEKEMIYQSAYKTYVSVNRFIPILLVITMISNLFFGTGMLATVVVGAMWLFQTMSYTRSCLKLKGSKISEMQ